jgi:large subunit ribosomal protein L15
MNIQSLSPAIGARTSKRRVGRGISAGQGKTCGRGQKGQNSRSGGGVRLGFEGGQMPLMRRLPKRGFDCPSKKVYSIVNLDALNAFDKDTVVTEDLLFENRIIGKREKDGLKVLGNGELTRPLTVQAKKFTASAVQKIEKIGGKAEVK